MLAQQPCACAASCDTVQSHLRACPGFAGPPHAWPSGDACARGAAFQRPNSYRCACSPCRSLIKELFDVPLAAVVAIDEVLHVISPQVRGDLV